MKVAEKFTDIELINAINDPVSLNRAILYLYEQFSASTNSFIIGYGASEQDAEDVFQDTVVSFIGMVNKGKYRMEASIKTLLTAIARNIWLNEVRKRERSEQREKQFEHAREQLEVDVSQHIGDLEQKKQVRDLLYRLGEPCRKLLMLYYYESLSMKEIVDHLPYDNEQVVRNKKYKCLQQLTGYIKEHPLLAKQINETAK